MEKLIFITEDNEEVEFVIVANTRIAGVDYLLVEDTEDEGQAYILKDVSEGSEPDGNYVMVEDDKEFEAVAKIFEDELEDEIDVTVE